MSKPSRRPVREARKARRRQQEALRRLQRQQGMEPRRSATLPNRTSCWQTPEQETAAREQVVHGHLQLWRQLLPTLLKRLSKIPDPRDPKKLRHKITTLLVFGLLSFVFQMPSRREANRKMTRPVFKENLRELFPEFEELPHHDTLYRLLARIEVTEIESAHVELIRRWIRKKKFRRYLIDQCYPIAIDGTQKLTRDLPWSDQALQRQIGPQDRQTRQYYAYVLEASLAFHNGMVLPLMSEFLSLPEDASDADKQDCELNAFYRLAERLKQEFPRLPVLLLLDGLYPNGPLMELCRRYRWQFMIVLKDASLARVWQDAEGLRSLEPHHHHDQVWGNRQQHFWWANDIDYTYGRNDSKSLKLHVVVCEETWQVVDDEDQIQTRHSRHAWISSHPLSRGNVHERCNLAARHRWGIEASFLVEKHQGYHYEHAFAYDFNALKGYHYLTRLGHLFNTLARYCQRLHEYVQTLGVRGLVELLRETIAGPWLDLEAIRAARKQRYQVRLL